MGREAPTFEPDEKDFGNTARAKRRKRETEKISEMTTPEAQEYLATISAVRHIMPETFRNSRPLFKQFGIPEPAPNLRSIPHHEIESNDDVADVRGLSTDALKHYEEALHFNVETFQKRMHEIKTRIREAHTANANTSVLELEDQLNALKEKLSINKFRLELASNELHKRGLTTTFEREFRKEFAEHPTKKTIPVAEINSKATQSAEHQEQDTSLGIPELDEIEKLLEEQGLYDATRPEIQPLLRQIHSETAATFRDLKAYVEEMNKMLTAKARNRVAEKSFRKKLASIDNPFRDLTRREELFPFATSLDYRFEDLKTMLLWTMGMLKRIYKKTGQTLNIDTDIIKSISRSAKELGMAARGNSERQSPSKPQRPIDLMQIYNH